jgi:peptidoglycan/xylan/chitin deacetylase (PgdA/CDA1 family)
VCLTFDDGYWDSHDIAARVLEEAGALGTFFITSGLIGSKELLWFDRAALAYRYLASSRLLEAYLLASGADIEPLHREWSLGSWMGLLKVAGPEMRSRILRQFDSVALPEEARRLCRLMTVEQVLALSTAGHEIGSHTVSHPILTQIEEPMLVAECRGSRQVIEEWVGKAVYGLCYPNGDCNSKVVDVALAEGYRYACTTQCGLNAGHTDPMRLMRVAIWPDAVMDGNGSCSVVRLRSEMAMVHRGMRKAMALATRAGRYDGE